MKLLIFDTETTGLLPKTNVDISLYPYIVQLSYIIFNTKNNKIEKVFNQIIRPEIQIPTESSNIHKITDNIAKEYDFGIERSLNYFMDDYYQCNKLVAHNLKFDLTVLKAEYTRYASKITEPRKRKYIKQFLNDLENYQNIKKCCTMISTTSFCNLKQKNGNGIKWPRLSELFRILFSINLDENKMHDAYYDVLVCLCCYMMFFNKISITEKNSHIKKEITNLILN
jgi:DNA polymerase III epsilon subunit-like protein